MDLISQSSLDTEAKCLAQLGNFAKLPTEIRLCIWEFLFLGLQKAAHCHLRPSTLSILSCSRYLYHEISPHFYKGMQHAIQLCPLHAEQSWMSLGIFSPKVTATWILKDIDEVRDHLNKFPLGRMRDDCLHVEIPPSTRRDPGRIIQLWQKTNELVNILTALPQVPHVRVRLLGTWHQRGKPMESIKYTDGYRPDYEIVLLPFTRLRSWDCILPRTLYNMTLVEPSPSTHCLLPRLEGYEYEPLAPQFHPDPDGGISDLKQWTMDTRLFLDKNLDEIPGPTADCLRLERFQKWYEAGDSWKSSYEEQFVSDLDTNPDMVRKHDPFFMAASYRHRVLISLHHVFHAMRDDREPAWKVRNGHTKLYTTWNPRVWSMSKPCGIGVGIGCTGPLTQEQTRLYDRYTSGVMKGSQFAVRYTDVLKRRKDFLDGEREKIKRL